MKPKLVLLTAVLIVSASWQASAQHAVAPSLAEPSKDSSQTGKGSLSGSVRSSSLEPGEKSLIDHKALIFNTSGEVKILRKGENTWRDLAKETVIEEGDQIKTGADSFVEIVYDEYYLNIARIEADTLAEFRAIEPTDIFLSDGGVFNDLDGLAKGTTYEVATPTSVAGVRGTEFFRAYEASTKTDRTICSKGAVDVYLLRDNGDLIPERIRVEGGRSLEMKHDIVTQAVLKENLSDIRPVPMTEEHRQTMNHVNESRENLTQFIGDPTVMKTMEDKFRKIQNDPSKRDALMSEMKENDKKNFGDHGPAGPGTPGGPGGPNLGDSGHSSSGDSGAASFESSPKDSHKKSQGKSGSVTDERRTNMNASSKGDFVGSKEEHALKEPAAMTRDPAPGEMTTVREIAPKEIMAVKDMGPKEIINRAPMERMPEVRTPHMDRIMPAQNIENKMAMPNFERMTEKQYHKALEHFEKRAELHENRQKPTPPPCADGNSGPGCGGHSGQG